MRVVLTVEHDPYGVRPLYQALLTSQETAHAELLPAPPVTGELSSGAAEAVGLLVNDGTGAAVATVLVAWIRSRQWHVRVTLTRPGGRKFELNLRTRDDEAARSLLAEVARFLDDEPAAAPRESPSEQTEIEP